jgi:hypothetical protein
MSVETNLDRGMIGSKRSSWKKVHFRDLALKVVEEHKDSSIEELARYFIEELQRYPDYIESIAIYIMANVRASLEARGGRPRGSGVSNNKGLEKLAKKVAAKVLMDYVLPDGKMLRDATGAECVAAGGWLKQVGEKVGAANIVGKKLTEADLRRLFRSR